MLPHYRSKFFLQLRDCEMGWVTKGANRMSIHPIVWLFVVFIVVLTVHESLSVGIGYLLGQ